MTAATTKRSNPLVLGLLALLFFGPVALATVMYLYGGDAWRPAGSTVHGVLLSDPRTLPEGNLPGEDRAAAFRGRWSLLQVGTAVECAEDCREGLYRTRQVRRALGKEMSRLKRFYIARGPAPEADFLREQHPGLVLMTPGSALYSGTLDTLGPISDGDVFIADPLGNVILRFPAGTAMKDMHQDLQLLLKASQIG